MIEIRKEIDKRFVVCGKIHAAELINSSIDAYMTKVYGAKRTKLYHTGVACYKNLETGERYKIW